MSDQQTPGFGQTAASEIEVRADQVKPGDYLLGLGRVQSFNDSGGTPAKRRITLFSEGSDWRVNLHPLHRVVVLRQTLDRGQSGASDAR